MKWGDFMLLVSQRQDADLGWAEEADLGSAAALQPDAAGNVHTSPLELVEATCGDGARHTAEGQRRAKEGYDDLSAVGVSGQGQLDRRSASEVESVVGRVSEHDPG
jgi:hypothetical protein